MKEQKQQIKVYRIVNADVENAQELLMSEEEYKKIKNESGIKHSIVLETELNALKSELADSKSLKEENEILKRKLAELEPKPVTEVKETRGRKPNTK